MSNIAKVFSYSKGVQEKREELLKINKQLKKEFVGIDHVIDMITKLMEPWRIMPEAQNRPIIINLWGMTGTGKTSLVRRVSELLKSKLIQVDLGEFSDNKNFSVDFYEKYYDLSEQECIILLDELQNCKTIGQLGGELDRSSLRGLWSLLSDGKIVPDKRISKEYYQEEIEDAIQSYLRHGGVVPQSKKMKLQEQTKAYIKTNDVVVYDPDNEVEEVEDEDDDLAAVDESQIIPWHISEWTIGNIIKACGKKIKYSKYEIQEKLNKDFLNTAKFLLEILDKLEIQPQLNYQKSIIFIAGNLDEVYLMSKSANPDITPDILHENSRKITVPDIKNSLMKKFRPGQVARLGNSHIIYYAFNEQNFRDIIQLDLKRIKRNISDQFDVNLTFDKSVENLIYNEGVFPTQGARPVLSTVSTLVEASIPSCLKELITQYDKNYLLAPINVRMMLDGKENIAIFEMIDENNRRLNHEKVFLSIETLRNPIYDDEHVLIAVHEAGHTICQLVEFNEIPTKICAFSPNVNSDGYMERKLKEYTTKEMVYSYITVALGGWAAEKIIFGENRMGNGAIGDISKASGEAAAAIQSWGFGDLPIVIQRNSREDNEGVEYDSNTNAQIRKIIEECLEKATNNIKKNKKLLFEISGELLNKPHLVPQDLKEILKKYNFKLHKKTKLTSIFEDEISKIGIEWKPQYE